MKKEFTEKFLPLLTSDSDFIKFDVSIQTMFCIFFGHICSIYCTTLADNDVIDHLGRQSRNRL